jgi:hypothetical protein
MSSPTDDRDPWFIAEAEEEGLPLLFRVRELTPAGVEPKKYPFLISVLWKFEHSGTGMPADEVMDQMNDFEDRLDALEGPAIGYMMVSITGNGRKEWLWYVADRSRYMSGVNRVLSASPVHYPVDFEASSDPTWETFRAFIEGAQEKQ